jgi:hypothetical protein
MKKLLSNLPPWEALIYLGIGLAGMAYLVTSGGLTFWTTFR